jgi:hypothetical protein
VVDSYIPPIDDQPKDLPADQPIEAPDAQVEPAGREPGSDDVTEEERLELIRQQRDEREGHGHAIERLDRLSLVELKEDLTSLTADIAFAQEHRADLTNKHLVRELSDYRSLVVSAIQRREAAERQAKGNGTAPQPDLFKVLSAAELLSQPPDPTRWVWEGCLAVRSANLIAALPYVGKSTFCVCLSIAVARGVPFLKRNTQKGAALYVYLDGPRDEIKEKFTAMGLNEYDQVFVYAGRKPDRVVQWVTEKVAQYNVKLLIVDTWQKFFSFKDINDNSETINTTQPLIDAAGEKDFAILFITHAGKHSRVLGATGLEGTVRTSLYVKTLENGQCRILNSQQNDGKPFDGVAISDPSDGFLEVLGSVKEAQILAAKPKITEVLSEAESPLTEREIRAELVTTGRGILSRALRLMLDAGELERTKSGTNKQGRKVYLWNLAGRLFPDDPPKQTPEERALELFGKEPGD